MQYYQNKNFFCAKYNKNMKLMIMKKYQNIQQYSQLTFSYQFCSFLAYIKISCPKDVYYWIHECMKL